MTNKVFTNKSNAARYAKQQIDKGTAPASEYSVEASGDGFAVVWSVAPAEAERREELVQDAVSTLRKNTRAKKTAAPSAGRKHEVRDGVLALLRRPEGATVAQIKELTGWKYTGSFLFGALPKAGIELRKEKGADGMVYRVAAEQVSA